MKLTTLIAVIFLISSIAYPQAYLPKEVKLAKVQKLVRSNSGEPETLDPLFQSSRIAKNIISEIFEPYVIVYQNGKIVGGLTESWKQVSPNKWQFKVRKNAKFSNGRAITSADFIYSLRRYMDPKSAANYGSVFGYYLKNGEAVISGKKPVEELGIKATSPSTFEIETETPTPYLPEILETSPFSIVNQEAIQKYGKDWLKPENIVASGPYTLKEWIVNNKITLVKNPYYWDAKNVMLDEIVFLPIDNQVTDLKLFESGETDIVFEAPVDQIPILQKKYPNEFINFPLVAIRYYSFNNKDPLLSDVRVRKALNLVVDRDILAEKVVADGQIVSYSIVSDGVPGAKPTSYDWVKWPMDKRIAEAKKLLAEAGVKEGTELKLVYDPGDLQRKISTFLASEWKDKLGLSIKYETTEFKVLLKKRRDLDYQIAINRWYGQYNEATSFIGLLRCGSFQNVNGFCNQEAEKLFNDAEYQKTSAARQAKLETGLRLVMDQYPILPLLNISLPRLINQKVGGFVSDPLDRHYSKFIYIKE